jgi:hypothetical protein
MRRSNSVFEVSTFFSWMSCFYHRLVLEGVFLNWRVYGVASFTSSISVHGWNMIFVLRRYQVLYEGSRLFSPCLRSGLSFSRSASIGKHMLEFALTEVRNNLLLPSSPLDDPSNPNASTSSLPPSHVNSWP